jgi:hypothetical protein
MKFIYLSPLYFMLSFFTTLYPSEADILYACVQSACNSTSNNREVITTQPTTASRTALGPTQPPIQWIRGALSLGIKRQGREAHHSPLSSAELKE